MPEKPNSEKEQPVTTEESPFEKPECENDNWSSDQKKNSYYYDDSHGYEIYNPDDDEVEDDVDKPEDKPDNSAK